MLHYAMTENATFASQAPLIEALEALMQEDEAQFLSIVQRMCLALSMESNESTSKSQLQIIEEILIACPSLACSPRKPDNIYPLHLAASIGDVHLGCIIASACPAATVAKNQKGKTPLHFAARENNVEFVEMLLRLNPLSAQITTEKLKLPLHFAAAEGNTEICKKLLQVFPGGAAKRSLKGKLPLHLASRRGSLETMLPLLSAYPQGSESGDWECATPLSLAIRDSQESIANHLIDECPHALKLQDICGALPIETAIRNSTSFRLFSKMVHSWPEGCKCLLENVKSDENVDVWEWCKIELCLQASSGIIQRYSKKCMLPMQQKVGHYLPLHTALEISSCASLHCRVLRTCKDLVSRRNEHGCYPLHIAAKHCKECSLVVIKRLLEIFPQAASEKDSFGHLPLHIALSSTKANASIIAALLIANPLSVSEPYLSTNTELCGIPPLLLAIHHGCKMDVIYTLSRFDPSFYYYNQQSCQFRL